MAKNEQMKAWARLGAKARLKQLAAERASIYREFPQLKFQPRPQSTSAPTLVDKPTRRKRTGKAQSKSLKKRWADWRAGKGPKPGRKSKNAGRKNVKKRNARQEGQRRRRAREKRELKAVAQQD